MPKYTSPGETAEHFGVSLHTLRRWERDNKIQAIRTPSGQRRYDVASYTGLSNQRTERAIIAYARVSSRSQKADLIMLRALRDSSFTVSSDGIAIVTVQALLINALI
ncbi:putative site-specific integrase-resolvase [Cylindrospermum stagnale PCC 7417]|uniref:Putative site-specific integrase-resolvase n=1 Tax=Cylindrospermum stagnale PCC 7417 TaxID=56107 RepID=K9X1I6_9NOST|nr:putative site-specific integrase-resolvase [Cylindrospermum stagnale PCC 7417]